MNGVLEDLDRSRKTIGFFLDLEKAFDTMSHSLLFEKLAMHGVDGLVLKWLRSYLDDRRQCVAITGRRERILNVEHTSGCRSVERGVPQGPFWVHCCF